MLLKVYLFIVAAMSVATFVLYGVDKRRAQDGRWRIPEWILLMCGILGGSVGACSAMRLFRHKTLHWYFWVINVLAFMVQLFLSLYLATR